MGLPRISVLGFLDRSNEVGPAVFVKGLRKRRCIGSRRSAARLTLLCAGWLTEALHWHRIDGGLLLDADTGPVGVNVKDAVFWVLVFSPAWSLPLGVIGAVLGAKRARTLGARRKRTRGSAA